MLPHWGRCGGEEGREEDGSGDERQWGGANEMGSKDLVTLDFGVKDSSEHGFGHVEMRLKQ